MFFLAQASSWQSEGHMYVLLLSAPYLGCRAPTKHRSLRYKTFLVTVHACVAGVWEYITTGFVSPLSYNVLMETR